MNFSEVLPNLYVGSCPESTDDIDRLRQQLGVSAVLNVQTDEDMDFGGCDWRKLKTHYRRTKVDVRRVPIPDCNTEELRSNLPKCVQILQELLRDDHIVYVHCSAGLSRSPTVVLTYLHWVQQLDLDKAVRLLTSCRHCSPNLDAIRLANEDLVAD